MEFTCNQYDLSKALNIVSKAISNRTTLPLLKGILLETTSNRFLKLTASDMDMSIEKSIPVQIIKEGSTVVSAKLFSDIIKKLPNDEIKIKNEESVVTIKCLSSEFNIVGQEADDFPKIGEITRDNVIKLNKNIIGNMIRKTSFAASPEEAKGIIVGVLIEIMDGNLSMVALDGFRMAIARESISNRERVKLIIAARILNEINKIFAEEDDNEVEIILEDQKAVFILNDTYIVLRIMEGEFIKYNEILPKEHQTVLKINRSEIIDCLERASLLAREKRNNLIRLVISDENLTISSQSDEGQLREEMIVEKEGSDLEIGFNVKYLLEVFKATDDEQIIMEFNTNISPCIVKPLEGDEYEYLILPVRISASIF